MPLSYIMGNGKLKKIAEKVGVKRMGKKKMVVSEVCNMEEIAVMGRLQK